MMKSISRKESRTMCLGFVVGVLLLLLAGGFRARAAETGAPYCVPNVTLFYNTTGSRPFMSSANSYIFVGNLESDAEITNIKCSSKKIEAFSSDDKISLYLRAKKLKDGQTERVTFTVKQDGAAYDLGCNVTFRKEINPLESVKVGKKTTRKFKKNSNKFKVSVKKINSSKVKIKLNLKPGYKLGKVRAGYWKKGWRKEETKNFKNGGKVSTKYLGASLVSIYVDFYEDADLQGIATPSGLKKYYGYRSAYYELKFK